MSDGQIRSEEGAYKDGTDADGNAVKILVVQGAYSHVAPGKFFHLSYKSAISYFSIISIKMVKLTGSTMNPTRTVTDLKLAKESVASSLARMLQLIQIFSSHSLDKNPLQKFL